MLTLNLEQPFTTADIDNALSFRQKQNKIVSKKLQKLGAVVLLLTLIGGYFWGIRFDKPDDLTKIFILLLPLTFGVFNIFHPYLHFWLGGSQHEFFEYLFASMETSHNCKAFIQMPGMEKYKEYVEKVKQQGRSLTNFECDEIIKKYQSLM